MSERDSHCRCCCCFSFLTKTILGSLKIFLGHPTLFFSIFALTTLPLSLLLISLSLSSHPLTTQIHHLEALSFLVPTRFESLHIQEESRRDALFLFALRALYFLPCYVLSLFAVIASVSSTSLACNGKRPTLASVVSAVKITWKRPLVTSIFVYGCMVLYAQVPRALAAVVGNLGVGFLVVAVGLGLEVYLMAVMSLALVVSVAEERIGTDAIRIGSSLMKGNRVCGWVLSGLFLIGSGVIGWEVEWWMDGQDSWMGEPVVVEMWLWERVGLICLFGLLVLWSYVVTTVFYCGCRQRYIIREGDVIIGAS